MSKLKELLKGIDDGIPDTPKPSHRLSLEEIQHYLQTETNPSMIYKWAKMYIEYSDWIEE